ncbi:MAG: helix-turn-helix domain-containing protein [Pikeienuella sp.]
MQLRGFDDYEVTLGDQIRGERASMGKTIADVQRELRIKGELILGIENADLSAFPNDSVVSGYVRSYARYLRMDPDAVYERFCAESGFVAPTRSSPGPASGARRLDNPGRSTGPTAFDQSRFAVVPNQTRFAARISLGWLASVVALLALVSGIAAGGYALLQNVQKVGFAPLPEAPQVAAEPPRIIEAEFADVSIARPTVEAYGSGGVLAAVFAPDDAPPLQRRDGPISAIDPDEAGMIAALTVPVDPRDPAQEPPVSGVEAGGDPALTPPEETVGTVASAEQPAPERVVAPGEAGLAIRAVDDAWIRVRDENRAVIFEGILGPGERYKLPERIAEAELRAGNAGAVFFMVDGEIYGPAGRPGSVVKRVPVSAEAIRAGYARITEEGASSDAVAAVDGLELPASAEVSDRQASALASE